MLFLAEIPYSSKFSRHKNFVKHSKFVKLLIFVIKIWWLLQNFVIAVRPSCGCGTVPCITTSLCLFLGYVLLIRSSFGWFCGRLGCLFSPALLPRICWPPREPDTEEWHSEWEKTWFNVRCTRRSAREKATPSRIKFSWIKNSWTRGQSRNSRKYYATKIWSYTV